MTTELTKHKICFSSQVLVLSHEIYVLIDDLIRQGRWEESLKQIDEIRNGDDFEILMRKIKIYIGKNDFSSADLIRHQIDDLQLDDVVDQIRYGNAKNHLYWSSRKMDELKQSLMFTEKSINMAHSQNIEIPKHQIATYHRTNGLYYWQTGDLDEAELNYNNAFDIYQKMENKTGLQGKASILMLMGLVQRHKGNMDKALEFYEASASNYIRLGDKQSYAKVLNNMGNVYKNLNKFDKAKKKFTEALEINQELGNLFEMSLVLNNLGIVDESLGNIDDSIISYTESLKIASELNHDELKISPLNNLAIIQKDRGNLKVAHVNYSKALELSRKVKKTHNIAKILPNVASICVLQGRFEQAKEYYLEFRDIYSNYNDPELMFIPNQYLAYMYTEQENYQEAQKLEQDNFEIACKMNDNKRIAMTLIHLISLSLNQSKIEEAEKWMMELNRYKKDFSDRELVIYEISNLIIKFEHTKDRFSQDLYNEFRYILDKRDLNIFTYVLISFNLIEMILIKLSKEGDERDLGEAYDIIENINKLNLNQEQYSIYFTTQLLKVKLLLVELKLKQARDLIDKLIIETEKKGYFRIMNETKNALEQIVSGDSMWLKIESTNHLMSKRIEALDIIRFVRAKGNSFNAFPTF